MYVWRLLVQYYTKVSRSVLLALPFYSLATLANGVDTICPRVFKLYGISPKLWEKAKDLLLQFIKLLKWKGGEVTAAHHCAFLQHVVTKIRVAC